MIWLLLYQVCVRSRVERLPRILRDVKIAHEKTISEGKPAPDNWDPSRPWNLQLKMLLDDSKWWWDQFERKAFAFIAKIARLNEVVDGDAPVASGVSSTIMEPPKQTSRNAPNEKGGPKPQRAASDGPPYKATKKGHMLCSDFTSQGGCDGGKPGSWCTYDRTKIHLCNSCLRPHLQAACKETGPQQRPQNTKRKGGNQNSQQWPDKKVRY